MISKHALYRAFFILCFVFLCLSKITIAGDESAENTPIPAAWEKWSGLPIVSVEYLCDGGFSGAKVRAATVVQVGDVYSRSSIRKSIEQIYSLREFSGIEVNAETMGDGVKLTFLLARQLKAGKIRLAGNEKLKNDEIVKVMKLKPGQKGQEYDESIARADVEAIGKLYESRGFLNADISFVTHIDEGKKQADVSFKISEGVQPVVKDIIFLGVNEAVIRNAALIKSMKKIKRGKVYKGQKALDSDVKEIEKLYREKGYITARIKSAQPLPAENLKESDLKNGIVVVVIEIQQGKKVDIEIEVDGKVKKDDDIEKAIAISRMHSISEPVLRKSAEDIRNPYVAKGYYLAEVTYELLRDKIWNFSNASDVAEWEPMLETASPDNAPQIQNSQVSIHADKYQKISIRMRTSKGTAGRLRWVADNRKAYYLDFDLISDNQFHNYEIDMRTFEITGRSLKKLKQEEVPDDTLKTLEGIKNAKAQGAEGLMNMVKAELGEREATKFRALILKYAKRRRNEDWSGTIKQLQFGIVDAIGADIDVEWIRAKMTEESIPVIFTVTRNQLIRIKTEVSLLNADGTKLKIGVENIRKQMLTRKKHPCAFWTLKRYFPNGIFSEAVLETDLRAIIAFYKDNGYSQAKIVHKKVDPIPEKGEMDIAITIDEGVKTAITEVVLETNHENILDYDETLLHLPSFRDQDVVIEERKPLLVRYKITTAKAFLEDDTVADRSYLRSRYADKGYFAQIEAIQQFNDEHTEVVVTYRITTDKRIMLDDEVEIRGNARTKRWVIERELSKPLMEEKVFNRAEIKASWQRLLDLGFLEDVRVSTEPVGGGNLHKLIVDVTERDAISINMHLGSDSTAALRAGVGASHINLWGTGRRADGKVQIGTEGMSYKLNYAEPRLLGLRAQGLADAYRYSKLIEYEDTGGNSEHYTEIWTGVATGISHQFHRINAFTYVYRYEVVDYMDIADENEKTSRIGSIEAIFQRDTRRNPMNPTNGWLNRITVEYANSLMGGDETFAKLMTSNTHYSQLSQDIILALGIQTGYTWGLGGTKRVLTPKKFNLNDYAIPRGYKWTAHDAGDTMLNLSMEIRFPLYSKIGAAFFFDSGYVFDELSRFDIGSMNSSIGVGLRFITPIGPVRLDYGYPIRETEKRNKLPHIAFGYAF